MPQKPQRQTDSYQDALNELAFDVKTIKENHLAHMAQDIDELSVELKESREEFKSGFTRLDERMFQIMLLALGGLTATLLGIFFA